MTPIETAEHKQRWQKRGAHIVRLHSDLRAQGMDWCKVQLHKPQWDLKKWSDVYEDTFLFEHYQDARSFEKKFEKYVNR